MSLIVCFYSTPNNLITFFVVEFVAKKELPNLIAQPGKDAGEMLRAGDEVFTIIVRYPSWSGVGPVGSGLLFYP